MSERDGRFPTTRITLVTRLRSGDDSEIRLAIDEICRVYSYPLYRYARRRGLNSFDADDIIQQLVLKFLRNGSFQRFNPTEGKLRAYLCTSLSNLITNWHRDESANRTELTGENETRQLRNETRYQSEALLDNETPEISFDRAWTQSIVSRSLKATREDYLRRGKAKLFDALVLILLDVANQESVTALAERFSMTPGAIRVALSRLKSDCKGKIISVIRETTGTESDAKEEIDYILSLWQ